MEPTRTERLLADGPFEVVLGLPTHVLVVHAVVVLVPLAALGVVVIALSGAWRERLRGVVLAVTIVATASAFVAAASGQELLDRFALEGDPLVDDHATIGALTRWWVLLLLLVLGAFLVLERRVLAAAPASADGSGESAGSSSARTGMRVLAVLLVVVAVVTTVQAVLTGHSGSRAVWERQVDATE